jgi:hypothetical protein
MTDVKTPAALEARNLVKNFTLRSGLELAPCTP